MIVNPFSYLIEKLKSKVDKSGDTMTGQLQIGQSSETPLIVQRTDSNGNTYIRFSNKDNILGNYGISHDKKPMFYAWGDMGDKEIALKSDITNVKTEVSVYDNGLFPTSKNVINSYQYCCVARNTGNGALYLLWYDAGSQGFRVGSVISGNSPSNGDSCVVSYPI